MHGIAQDFGAGAVAGDVPCIEIRNRLHLQRFQRESAERVGPMRHDEFVLRAEERLVDEEFVIAVLIELPIFCAIAMDSPHPRRGIPRIGDEFRMFRMELRVDNRLCWRRIDNLATAAIGCGNGNMRCAIALHRRDDKLFICTDTALAEAATGEFFQRPFCQRLQMNRLNLVGLGIEELCAIFGNHTGVAVHVIGIGELHDIAIGKRRFKKVGFARTMGRPDENPLVWRERGSQKVEVVVDGCVVCELIDMRARLGIVKFAKF